MAPDPAPVNPPSTLRRVRPPGWRAAMAALAVAVPLSGCSLFGAPEELRGNRAEAEMLRDITPGVSSRADVTAVLGSPSATSTFDQREWYYISAVSHIRPARVPGIANQRVVVVRFDDRGIVQGVEEKGDRDMRDVAVVDRTTPVPGNDRTLLQGLFGNIGRFGPGVAQPAAPGAGGGVPNP